jgi:hypothetical protein
MEVHSGFAARVFVFQGWLVDQDGRSHPVYHGRGAGTKESPRFHSRPDLELGQILRVCRCLKGWILIHINFTEVVAAPPSLTTSRHPHKDGK